VKGSEEGVEGREASLTSNQPEPNQLLSEPNHLPFSTPRPTFRSGDAQDVLHPAIGIDVAAACKQQAAAGTTVLNEGQEQAGSKRRAARVAQVVWDGV